MGSESLLIDLIFFLGCQKAAFEPPTVISLKQVGKKISIHKECAPGNQKKKSSFSYSIQNWNQKEGLLLKKLVLVSLHVCCSACLCSFNIIKNRRDYCFNWIIKGNITMCMPSCKIRTVNGDLCVAHSILAIFYMSLFAFGVGDSSPQVNARLLAVFMLLHLSLTNNFMCQRPSSSTQGFVNT